MKKQILVVRDFKARDAIHVVDVTGKNSAAVEKVMAGMLRNMSPDYFIDDSEAYAGESK